MHLRLIDRLDPLNSNSVDTHFPVDFVSQLAFITSISSKSLYEPRIKKEITLLGGVGQLSTTLLGTGLFMIPAIAANLAGVWSLWAWFILLLAICPIALTFALLGRQFPNAGGTAYFVRKAFNSKVERSVAWLF